MNPKENRQRKEALSIAALFLVAILWGVGFIFVKTSLEGGLSPAGVMLGRFALASLLSFFLFFRTIRREYKKGQWKSGIAIGVTLFAAFYMQTIAMQYTTPGNNAFITGAYVVLVPLLYWVISKKRPSGVMLVACVISFVGIAVLSLDPAEGFVPQLGDMLTLLGALIFAAQIVVTGMLANSIHPTVLVFMQVTVAAALSLILFLITDRQFVTFTNFKSAISIGYLGVFSTCICYFLQTTAQQYLSSSKTGIIMATEALFGAFFSVLLGYDDLTFRMVSGGVLMFLSIILPELWSMRNKNDERQADIPSTK